jgi:hypothetical protein
MYWEIEIFINTSMPFYIVKQGKKKVTLSIDSDIYNSYRKYCEDNGLLMSGKIDIFMKKEIETGKKTVKNVRKE